MSAPAKKVRHAQKFNHSWSHEKEFKGNNS